MRTHGVLVFVHCLSFNKKKYQINDFLGIFYYYSDVLKLKIKKKFNIFLIKKYF